MKLVKKIVNGIKNGVREELDGTYIAKDYRMSRKFRDCLVGAMGFKVCMVMMTIIICAVNYWIWTNTGFKPQIRSKAGMDITFILAIFVFYMWADWVRTLICRAVSCKKKRKSTIIEIVIVIALAFLVLYKPVIWIVPTLFVINTIIEIAVLERKSETEPAQEMKTFEEILD